MSDASASGAEQIDAPLSGASPWPEIMAPLCEWADTPPAKTSRRKINGSAASDAYLIEFQKAVPSGKHGIQDGSERRVFRDSFRLGVHPVDSRVPQLRAIGQTTLTSELDAFFEGHIVWEKKELEAVVSAVHNQSRSNGGIAGWNGLDFAKIASIAIIKVNTFTFH